MPASAPGALGARTCRARTLHKTNRRFITFEHEDSVDAVFAHGTMHELGGKRVEVKTATPKGTGSLRQPTPPRGPVMVPHGMARPPATYGAASGYQPVGYPPPYAPLGVFAGSVPGTPPGVVAGYPAPAYPYGPYSHAMLPPYYYAGGERMAQGRGAGRATSPTAGMLPPAVLPPGGGVYGMLPAHGSAHDAVGAVPQQPPHQTEEHRCA